MARSQRLRGMVENVLKIHKSIINIGAKSGEQNHFPLVRSRAGIYNKPRD
jgi:hypothetical protein